MLDNIKNLDNSSFLAEFLSFFGLLGFYLFVLLFKYQFDAGFSVFFLLISRFITYSSGLKFCRTPFYFVYFCIEQVIVVFCHVLYILF